MIPRYSRKVMEDIWSDENKYRIWLEIEIYACEAYAELGLIPKEAVKTIRDKGDFSVSEINEIEKVTKHDVIAFLTSVANHVGPDSRYIHMGMTSSDVIDSSFSLQLVRSTDLLLKDMDSVLEVLKQRALESKYMPCIGRSHGIHAEPVTMGLKFARFYAEMSRNKKRLENAKKEIAFCAISGAAGTFANIDPFVQDYVAEKTGLGSEAVSTQIIPRDRHAMYFATLGVIASSIENIVTEIRHLQRTEVMEAEEFFSAGQKGSSAMPHKRNPVLSENLTGIARLIRSYVTPALENVALWHERDISHSSVERVIAPDATISLDFALNRLSGIIKNLVLYPENMKKNTDQLKGLVYSQRVLLSLTERGVSREEAYIMVQRNAMKVWKEDRDFFEELKKDKEIISLINEEDLSGLFDINYHYKYIDNIFKRVFG